MKALIADDQEIIIELVKAICRQEQIDFVTACSAEQAVHIWNDDIDVVITDMRMRQDDSGQRLCNWVKNRKPKTKVVLVSSVAPLVENTFDHAINKRNVVKELSAYLKGMKNEQSS